jgi:hypothetical protein
MERGYLFSLFSMVDIIIYNQRFEPTTTTTPLIVQVPSISFLVQDKDKTRQVQNFYIFLQQQFRSGTSFSRHNSNSFAH